MRMGHIAGVETLAGMSDEEAIKKSRELFAARASEFDGFEVWELTRMVIQHPPAKPIGAMHPAPVSLPDSPSVPQAG
jgi:hypothetical protein